MNVDICKRKNNKKRTFLILNKDQCKHYPSSPTKALNMFDDLYLCIKSLYENDKVLVIGFAETATALGYRVAKDLGCDYIQTTRENLPEEDTLYFSEEHSHATEQKLYNIDFTVYDKILLIDDEITTGKTMLNIIEVLSSRTQAKFGVASLINSMSEEQLQVFEDKGISVDYIVHYNSSPFSERVQEIQLGGVEVDISSFDFPFVDYQTLYISGYKDPRYFVDLSKNDNDECFDSINKAIESHDAILKQAHDILVLGTEECMYPAIEVASALEKTYPDTKVVCHSTTRSPIAVSKGEGYPLTSAYAIKSVYNEDRDTYIYNLRQYDKVIVITEVGTNPTDLVNALTFTGNKDITVVKIGR